ARNSRRAHRAVSRSQYKDRPRGRQGRERFQQGFSPKRHSRAGGASTVWHTELSPVPEKRAVRRPCRTFGREGREGDRVERRAAVRAGVRAGDAEVRGRQWYVKPRQVMAVSRAA